MKSLVLIVSLFISSVSFATPALESLACRLSNGVTLKTDANDSSIVISKFGFIQKSFKATVSGDQQAGQSIIELKDLNGESNYLVYLPLDLKNNDLQQLEGQVGQVDPVLKYVRLVATASCNIYLQAK